MSTRTVSVLIPITGSVCIMLDVASEADDDAILAAAMDAYDAKEHELEWEFTPHVSEGNVCHAMVSDYDISEED